MPKIVDQQLRRRELGEAVLRVIQRDGIPGASLRAVAKEAGLSMGALRHYFASHAEMLRFSLYLVGEHIQARLASVSLAGDPRQLAEQMIGELLPTDDRRRAEAQIWLAFIGASLTDSSLHAYKNEVHDWLRSTLEQVMQHLDDAGLLRPEVNPELELTRLHALADGLAFHAVTRPELISEPILTSVLAHHLDELCGASQAPRSPR